MIQSVLVEAPESAELPLSDMHADVAAIEWTQDTHQFNRNLNDPSIDRWVRGWTEGRIDMTAAVANPSNVLLMGEHGGALMVMHGPGIFEVHTHCLPAGRGPWMERFCRAAEFIMFTRTNAVELMTRVPLGNIAATALVVRAGWKFECRAERGWVLDREPIPADIYARRLQDWMVEADGLVERGRWFHTKLEQEFERLGRPEAAHEDDDVHNRYVGLAAEMFMYGVPEKGILFYNRWATLAGYAPISLFVRTPLTVDIVTALVHVSAKSFYVSLIR